MDSPGSKLGIVCSFISTCLEMRFESSVAILLLPGKFRCKSYFVFMVAFATVFVPMLRLGVVRQ